MKNIGNKRFLFALALGGILLGGCREDETLDLVGYPSSTVGISIAETEDAATVELKAVYDGGGKIGVDGVLSRPYLFTLDKPSTEDVVLKIEPVIVNIPTDKVEISAREIRIPAGAHKADTVFVNFLDPDFSFAEPDLAERTYELGVKIVDMQGTRVALSESAEAKVVVKKSAYVAGGSITGEGGREVVFKRSYWEGNILNEEKMEYAFKAYLDRPASEDVKVTFTTTGLPEQFAGDAKVTPAELIIPAGAVESTEEAVWTLTDDFLLTTDQPEEHTLQLTASFESADPTVQAIEDAHTIEIQVIKALDAIDVVNEMEADWTPFDRAGWTAVLNDGSTADVLDGDTYSYFMAYSNSVTLDMQQTLSVSGIVIESFGEMNYYAPDAFDILISDDGENWKSVGYREPEQMGVYYIKCLSILNTRYLKIDFANSSGGYVSEIRVYGKQ